LRKKAAITAFFHLSKSKTIIMLKVEHIGIAVKDFSHSVQLYEKLLNTDCYKKEAVESEKVNTAFFKQGETKIELLESTDADGVIAKFIEKKGRVYTILLLKLQILRQKCCDYRRKALPF